MKKKNYKEIDREKERGKRRYLERVVEAEEAEEQIRNYAGILLPEESGEAASLPEAVPSRE